MHVAHCPCTRTVVTRCSSRSGTALPRARIVPQRTCGQGCVVTLHPDNQTWRAQAKTQTVEQQVDPWARVVEQERGGETVEVTVKRANKGGLIVKLGELEGFLPYNQLSATTMRKGHLGDMSFLINQKLRAKIISVDMQSSRREIIFSEKRALQSVALQRMKRGDVLKGRVRNVEDYGVFVDLVDVPGLSGLVHKTEISWDPVTSSTEDSFQRGDPVQVMVLDADSAKCRLSLSIKQLTPDPLKLTLDTLSWGATAGVPPEVQVLIDRLNVDLSVDKVVVTRQAQDPHHVAQELQVFLTKETGEPGTHTVVARLGAVLQELKIVTSLSRDQVKALLQSVVAASK